MRRKNNNIGMFIIIIIIVIVLILFLVKNLFFKDSTKGYKEYVKSYEEAILSYMDTEIPKDSDSVSYDFDEITKILIDNGYLKEYSDSSVKVTANPIVIQKKDYNISFYNYNNATTLENRFELVFEKNGKEYTCTKNECK